MRELRMRRGREEELLGAGIYESGLRNKESGA